jgi:hypothetical protein
MSRKDAKFFLASLRLFAKRKRKSSSDGATPQKFLALVGDFSKSPDLSKFDTA